uniref:Uncharacterized protein n=1 Tax=Romanomermis culicivorax TaxID=13658 RepID=A0A915HPJ2_ROMCU
MQNIHKRKHQQHTERKEKEMYTKKNIRPFSIARLESINSEFAHSGIRSNGESLTWESLNCEFVHLGTALFGIAQLRIAQLEIAHFTAHQAPQFRFAIFYCSRFFSFFLDIFFVGDQFLRLQGKIAILAASPDDRGAFTPKPRVVCVLLVIGRPVIRAAQAQGRPGPQSVAVF